MSKRNQATPTTTVTSAGNKVLSFTVPPWFEERIITAARRKGLSKATYVIMAIDKCLTEDEEKLARKVEG